MCITEYNEAETMQMFKAEGRKEGRKEGREQGKLEIVLELVREGILTVAEGARRLGMAETELEDRIK